MLPISIMSPKNRPGKRKLKQTFANHISAIAQSEDGKAAVSKEDKKTSAAAAVLLDADNFPKKRFFRSRAHCNPLSHNDGFEYPTEAGEANWTVHYPNVPERDRVVRILDIGMGFGGLTVELARLFPDKLVLGMEIRAKLCEYVRLRIEALRLGQKDKEGPDYQNAACLRSNCMRYLPNFFGHEQIEKIFFCFPDPHFKAKNHRRRIVSHNLLTEYAYFLKPHGRLYTITDVKDLHDWHVDKCSNHPYFERIPNEEVLRDDPAVRAMIEKTEEGIKVERNKGEKHFAVFRRREKHELPAMEEYAKILFS